MKSIFILILLTWIGLSLYSCQDYDMPLAPPEPVDTSISEEDRNWEYTVSPKPYASRHFVNAYNDPIRFTGRIVYNNPGLDIVDDINGTPREIDYIFFYFSSNEYIKESNIDIETQTSLGANPQREKFDSIARSFGDTVYNNYYWRFVRYFFRPCEFHFTTLDDYDEKHPAGSSLNDIVQIRYYTAMPFLRSKYKNRRLGDYSLHTIELLKDFNVKQINLLRNDMMFRLDQRPAHTGLYSIRLTYINVDGKTLSMTTVPLNLLGRDE